MCGYVSFVYDVIHYGRFWSASAYGRARRDVEVAGVAILSAAWLVDVLRRISCKALAESFIRILHLVFFILGCRKVSDRREAKDGAAPPQYTASGDAFDDAKSFRSLPEYDANEFESATLDSKEAVAAINYV